MSKEVRNMWCGLNSQRPSHMPYWSQDLGFPFGENLCLDTLVRCHFWFHEKKSIFTSFPRVSQRTPGVALWLHSRDRHAKGMAAYRPSPLTHYRQLKGMPKIIPLSCPSLPEPLGRREACLADVTGTVRLKFQHWLYQHSASTEGMSMNCNVCFIFATHNDSV